MRASRPGSATNWMLLVVHPELTTKHGDQQDSSSQLRLLLNFVVFCFSVQTHKVKAADGAR